MRCLTRSLSFDIATSYCGDHLNDYGIVYLQSTGGRLANMDIDCDGIQGGPADDGRCGDSSDTQSITAFADTVASYGTGQQDLDANAHPYVVFGNDGSKPGWKTFDPQSVGVEPLSVMAVVCNNQLVCFYITLIATILANSPANATCSGLWCLGRYERR